MFISSKYTLLVIKSTSGTILKFRIEGTQCSVLKVFPLLITLFSCDLIQTVIKSYYEEPMPVPLTLSPYNVARGREQEDNGVGHPMGKVEHTNNVGHQQHHLFPKLKPRGVTTMRGGPQGSIVAYSESNLLAPLGSQQQRYNPPYHMQPRNAFLSGHMSE
jgi:hypothetical protein